MAENAAEENTAGLDCHTIFVAAPRALDIGKYAAARAQEMEAMASVSSRVWGNNKAMQTLPRHMRRRAASHNIKRLPRRLHKKGEREMQKSGPPVTVKRPGRYHRRRPANLLQEYVRRARRNVWLETHIWHAKRFHMTERWGYRLPLHPNDKGVRAAYRGAGKYCIMQDVSFMCCIEIQGAQKSILDPLTRLTHPEAGPGFGAARYLHGNREGSLVIYKHDQYPHSAIGPVKFMWNPPDGTPCTGHRQIWLWVHPACYQLTMQELKYIFNVAETHTSVTTDHRDNLSKQTTNSGVQRKEKKRKESVSQKGKSGDVGKDGSKVKTVDDVRASASETETYNNGEVTITSLKDLLCRFHLMGPLSHAILQDLLHVANIGRKSAATYENHSEIDQDGTAKTKRFKNSESGRETPLCESVEGEEGEESGISNSEELVVGDGGSDRQEQKKKKKKRRKEEVMKTEDGGSEGEEEMKKKTKKRRKKEKEDVMTVEESESGREEEKKKKKSKEDEVMMVDNGGSDVEEEIKKKKKKRRKEKEKEVEDDISGREEEKRKEEEVKMVDDGGSDVEKKPDVWWWREYYSEKTRVAHYERQEQLWEEMRGLQSAGELSSSVVLGLCVRDPRVFLPRKRRRVETDQAAIAEFTLDCVKRWPSDVSSSPIWDSDVRSKVKTSRMTEQEMNRLRSEHLIPGTPLELGTAESRIPILLIQHPGNSALSHQLHLAATPGLPLGWGAGWDIVLPQNWAMAFWVGLIYRGARAAGMKESLSTSTELGQGHFPEGFPDTEPCKVWEKQERTRLEGKYRRMPPAKRPNYTKLGSVTPFHYPWRRLVNEWSDGDVPMKDGSEAKEGEIVVLRNKKTLSTLDKLCLVHKRCSSAKFRRTTVGQKSVHENGSNTTCNPTDENIVNLIQDCLTNLVAVRISALQRGKVEPFSLICIPTKDDLATLSKDNKYGGPLEPFHKDPDFSSKRDRKKIKAKAKIVKTDKTTRTPVTTVGVSVVKTEKVSESKQKDQKERGQVEDKGNVKCSGLVTDVREVRFSCTRQVAGYVKQGGYHHGNGQGAGVGFVVLKAFMELLNSREKSSPLMALVRSARSNQYRFVYLSLVL